MSLVQDGSPQESWTLLDPHKVVQGRAMRNQLLEDTQRRMMLYKTKFVVGKFFSVVQVSSVSVPKASFSGVLAARAAAPSCCFSCCERGHNHGAQGIHHPNVAPQTTRTKHRIFLGRSRHVSVAHVRCVCLRDICRPFIEALQRGGICLQAWLPVFQFYWQCLSRQI